MSLIEVENHTELTEEFDNIDNYIEEEDSEFKKRGALSWGMSIAIHAALLLVMSCIIFMKPIQEEEPPIRIANIPPPTIIDDSTDPVELEPVEVDVNIEVEIESEVVTNLEIVVEEITTEEPEESEVPDAKGREDAISDSEMGSIAFMNAIGAGGGAKGAFGRIAGGDKKKLATGYGPNARRVKDAIDLTLMWLKKHQSENGQWDSDEYFVNCKEDVKCERGNDVNGADEALTGYSLLCFLGAGYDHKTPSRYKDTVQKGIDWILATQKADGLVGSRNYEHSVCTMALVEAFAMTNDMRLKGPAQLGINVILERQAKTGDYPLGWNYVSGNLARHDSSVSGWAVMALKSASASGLNVGDGIVGSKAWLEGAWKATNPKWEELDPYGESKFPYTWNSVTGEIKRDNLSFVGALCSVFLSSKGDMCNTMMNDATKRYFDTGAYKTNSYCLYYASLSAFMVGGDNWKNKWGHPNTGYVTWLLDGIVKDNTCFRGTWHHDKETWHGSETSPVLLHCYKTLALQVAIRYERIMKK